MECVRPALRVTGEDVRRWPVYLAEVDSHVAGFYALRVLDGEPFLFDFWIDPPVIGTGLGRALWDHAVDRAGRERYHHFLIESDPNAEGFYLHMGARRCGNRVSPETGRTLPLLRYDVAAEVECS